MAIIQPVVNSKTKERVVASLEGSSRDVFGGMFKWLVGSCLGVSLLVLSVLIYDVVSDSLPVFAQRGTDFLTYGTSSSAARTGVAQGLWGTLWIALFVIGLAIPFGVGCAVYLEEYAPKSRLTSFIELNIRNLAGVPSVVYGLLGLAIFVRAMKGITGGSSVMSAGLTIAILVLPVIVITTQEAIRAVPRALREGAFGLGATKSEVIRTLVLPYASPGILTGTLLSISRAVGEAAPLLLVGAASGFLTKTYAPWDVTKLREGFTAMPSLIASWLGKPSDEFAQNAAAAIIVLLVFVLVLNTCAVVLRQRFEKRR